ncbi:MAG TPA: carboxypeptidase regulatory-like domain-containing protein [Candidatus Saccharimonadales bacterium]|nr:carboxypeptidase regulatory-like domain-containing protein [Candidatus Saccharimonadales bacterium]
MAKDNKKDQAPSDYDPKIEARVDAMMSEDPKKGKPEPKKEANESKEPEASSSAPLLPGEKLPQFDDKPPAGEKGEKPAVLGGLVNNIPKKPADEENLKGDDYLESKETGKAVDEIISDESDRILAIEDAKAEMLAEGSAEIDDGGLMGKLRRFFGSKAFKIFFLIVLLAGLAAAFIYPDSRYFILNKAGVRASTSFKIVDEQTGQPLKDAAVEIAGNSTVSDADGNVSMNEILLGEQTLTVTKPAFAPVNKEVTIGWGSNPMDDLGLIATGTRYTFEVTDFLSGKPIGNAEAASGEASAKANDKGEIVLVVSEDKKETIKAEISAEGYRAEEISLKIGDESVKKILLVPARKHAFVSNRDGNFDLYKIDVDGKNEEKILDGTGNEREDEISILAHPNRDIIAFVSIRSDERTKDGAPISSLSIIDLNNNGIEEVAESERIQLVDFIDNKLVYIKTQPNADPESKRLHRLMSYDFDAKTEQELASTNYFNDVLAANGAVYYSPAEYKVNGSVGFYRIYPNGSGKITILAEEAWNLFRVGYDKINVAISDEWYQYDLNTDQLSQLNGSPPTLKSRIYTSGPDGKKAAWTDIRDGKGVLIIYDTETGKDKVIQRQSGLVNPVVWIDDDHIVYRVATGSETADYVVNVNGGDPKKIIDVTNTIGLDSFYFY